MSLEYRFDYVRGGLGDGGITVAECASKRGGEGWRLASAVHGNEGWALFFERPADARGPRGDHGSTGERLGMPHGLYVIRWKNCGGGSLAAVGYDDAGRNWFAPTNWILREPCFDWSNVESVAPVLLERDWRTRSTPDGGESPVVDAPPLEVPSALGQRPTFDSEWEAIREVLRKQTGRLEQLEQIIRRRDEVITLVRGMTKGWTPASKNYIDDDVDAIIASLARLDEEEKPRDSR